MKIQVCNAMIARSKDKIDSRKASLTHIPTDQSSQHLSSLMIFFLSEEKEKYTCKLYLLAYNASESTNQHGSIRKQHYINFITGAL